MIPRNSATVVVATCLLVAMAMLAAGQDEAEEPQVQLEVEGQAPVQSTGLGGGGQEQQQHQEVLPPTSGKHQHQAEDEHQQEQVANAPASSSTSKPRTSVQPTAAAAGVGLPFQLDILRWLEDMFAPKGKGGHHSKAVLEEPDSSVASSRLSTCHLLERAHFKCEVYNSTSDDGYITQLIRIVNPSLQETRPVPVVFYGGLGVSPAAFLAAALDRTHAQNWQAHDWPTETTNSSRSLALTLANNGFEVWLVAARGCDEANRRREAPPLSGAIVVDPSKAVHGKGGADFLKSAQGHLQQFHSHQSRLNYWSFGIDEVVKFEFGRQLELVLEASGQSQLSLVSYSNGALVSFAFMADRPDFVAKHIGFHASIGPAVYVNKFNVVLSAAGLASALSPPGWPFPQDQLDMLARGTFLKVCKSKFIRYSTCKLLLDSLYGFSDAFQSNLEPALFEYIGRPTSPRALTQTLQIGYSGQLRCYDYGLFGNLLVYRQLAPPNYELRAPPPAGATKFLLVAGERDAIADPASVRKLAKQIGGSGDFQQQQQQQQHSHHHQQVESVLVQGYNHLDLLAGWDVDVKVNRLVLERLHDRDLEASYPEAETDEQSQGGQENSGEQQQVAPESSQSTNGREGSRSMGEKGVAGISSDRQDQHRPEALEVDQEEIKPQVKPPQKAQKSQSSSSSTLPRETKQPSVLQHHPKQANRANKAPNSSSGTTARQVNASNGHRPIDRLRRTA